MRARQALLAACLAAATCTLAAAPAQSPQELLAQVRAGLASERSAREAREARFAAAEQAQQQRLAQARQTLQAEREALDELRAEFTANRERLAALRSRLSEQSGEVQDLSATFKQMAGQTRALLKDSLVSTQLPARSARLEGILQVEGVPAPQVLRELWVLLQEEMTETGRVVQYPAPVAAADGTGSEVLVTRVGGFTAVAGDRFLRYLPDSARLEAVQPQPGARYRKVAGAFTGAGTGMQPMVIDPTRGEILGLLSRVPGLWERILQGRAIGLIIIALGTLGLVLVLERLIVLHLEERRVERQKVTLAPDLRNGLGRVLHAAQENRHLEPELLELRLDEQIMRESPRLQRGLGAVRLFAVITPMLGLLGTVAGLIETFHSITLFGAGDARLMAGGISQALVTTALGLSTAIPLLLLHSLANMKSRRLIVVLDEQSAGIIAGRDLAPAEARRAA